MDIIKLSLLNQDDWGHKHARLFFAGFSQDSSLLIELIKRNLNSPLVPTSKKVYGQVLKQAQLNLDNLKLDHDCYLISHYSSHVDEPYVQSNSEFSPSIIDTKPLVELLERYESVEIVAWSFGVRVVRALCDVLPNLSEKISYAVALNGTILSVDLNYGIEPKAYDGTLDRFNSIMHKQFIKNMCSYAQALEVGVDLVKEPQESELALCSSEDKALVDGVRALRSLEDFKCELKLMPFVKLASAQDLNPTHEPIGELKASPLYFDEAYVALGDKIISSAAQYHYWTDYGLMRLNDVNNEHQFGFTLYTFYGPHLCPALIRDLMLCPLHKRAL